MEAGERSGSVLPKPAAQPSTRALAGPGVRRGRGSTCREDSVALHDRVSCVHRVPPTNAIGGELCRGELCSNAGSDRQDSEPDTRVEITVSACLEDLEDVTVGWVGHSLIEAQAVTPAGPTRLDGVDELPAVDGQAAERPDDRAELVQRELFNRCLRIIPAPGAKRSRDSRHVVEYEAKDRVFWFLTPRWTVTTLERQRRQCGRRQRRQCGRLSRRPRQGGRLH